MSKKIMFNDKFDLTQAVLDGRKTMTRRIIKLDKLGEYNFDNALKQEWGRKSIEAYINNYARYKVGEVIAIAQSYKDLGYAPDSLDRHPKDLSIRGLMKNSAGWNNKMFVKSYACKHHIKITNVKVERLQDISDEDCLKEGIIHVSTFLGQKIYHTPHVNGSYLSTNVAQEAFAYLIDKVSGKGTWESNPFVFAYEFVLFD